MVGPLDDATSVLATCSLEDSLQYFRMARLHRAEDRMFHIFEALLRKDELPLDTVAICMDEHPPLAYCALKRFLQPETVDIERPVEGRLAIMVLRNVIMSANDLGMAALAGLERLAPFIVDLDLATYLDLLWTACITIRAPEIVQEVLLVLQDCRISERPFTPVEQYAHSHTLAVVFDRAEEAADSCPCDEQGRPKRQREAPISAKLCPIPPPRNRNPGTEEEQVEPEMQSEFTIPTRVMANVRVDLKIPIRIHSHVRLRVASTPEHSTLPAAVVDAVVVRASRGELSLEVLHPLPPEWDSVDWYLYPSGSIVTSRAMVDAVQRLALEGMECCHFGNIIVGEAPLQQDDENLPREGPNNLELTSPLNDSQRAAVAAARLGCMSLIWGPPGEYKVNMCL